MFYFGLYILSLSPPRFSLSQSNMATKHHHLLLLSSAILLLLLPFSHSIGVNYGQLGNDLAPPKTVAEFLRTNTIIDRVKLFNTDPELLKAFADTNISVVMTAANGDVPLLVDAAQASRWVEEHVKPYYPKTKIRCIGVGNEILHSLDYSLIDNLVPAMKSLRAALLKAGFPNIMVSTASSLGILNASEPPSQGRFQAGWDVGVLKPMLQFLNQTKSPFMVNPYPYFGYDPTKLAYATFQPNPGMVDNVTKLTYYNMFDAQLDAVHSAMARLGYGNVDIMVAETGWPSLAEPFQPEVNVHTAAAYNGGLIKHVSSGVGTPLMPNRTVETYIFALFNENEKPGPTAERNFGLFQPDFTPVYDAGVMLKDQKEGNATEPAESPMEPPTMSPMESPTESPASSTAGYVADSPSEGPSATGKSDSGEIAPAPATGAASSMLSSNSVLQRLLMVVAVAVVMAVDAFWC